MEKLSEEHTLKFKYDSEEEREKHVKIMESQGFECIKQYKICWDYPVTEYSFHQPYAEFWKLIY